MTVTISNSGSDERGKLYGGQAGDQTGGEWRLRANYNRPWKCVLRHPDFLVAERIADNAEKAARNDKIGYDQYQRTTYWTELTKAGYDPAKVKTACEADCSAGVCANVKAAGYSLGVKELQATPITSTHYMRDTFSKLGFKVLTSAKYTAHTSEYLRRGDILLNDSHHTATVVTDGKLAWTVTGYTVNATRYLYPTAKKDVAKRIAKVPKGAKVEYLHAKSGNWRKCRYKGAVGWIYRKKDGKAILKAFK